MEGEREQASARPKSAQQHPQAPGASASALETMLRVATAVQQIMTVLNTAASEEVKIMTITKIVMTVTNLDGHQSSESTSLLKQWRSMQMI
jgi:hypothetical protein